MRDITLNFDGPFTYTEGRPIGFPNLLYAKFGKASDRSRIRVIHQLLKP